MDMDTLIARINVLARKKKTEGLTDEEKAEQQELYQQYLQIFRSGFKQQLASVKIVDSEGKDVTPKKLKEEKKKSKKMTH